MRRLLRKIAGVEKLERRLQEYQEIVATLRSQLRAASEESERRLVLIRALRDVNADLDRKLLGQ
jgi:hypothetical protein